MDTDEPTPPSPSSDVPTSTSTPRLPPPPTPTGSGSASPLDGFPPLEPRPRKRARWIVIAASTVAVLVVLTILVFHRGDGFPESIAALPRIHSDRARAAEDLAAHTEFAGVTVKVALYGNAETPVLIVERLNGIPDTLSAEPLDQFFSESVRGFEATTSTTIDAEAKVTRTIGAVSYVCASMRPGSASQPSLTGVLCIWKGDDVGIVISLRTTDPTAAIDDAQSVYESLH